MNIVERIKRRELLVCILFSDLGLGQLTCLKFTLSYLAGFWKPTIPQSPPSHLQDYSICSNARIELAWYAWWPTKMPKMIKGQIAENWKLTTTPKCRKCFRQLGQNVEKLFFEIVSMFWKIYWKKIAH
jgi:hypothetical protein